jgi:hypothetical protein
MRWVGSVARREDKINSYRVFVGKPEGERPLKDLVVDRILLK